MKTEQIQERHFQLKPSSNKRIICIVIIILIVLSSMPNYVKCDLIDTTASILLFFILTMFTCAGIGWWSRRGDPKY
jgi:hypothetical protein